MPQLQTTSCICSLLDSRYDSKNKKRNHTNNNCFYFQLIFAIIPPPGLLGGWPCFVVSLIMIGGIVIIVGDLAEIFGCLVGLHADVCE